MNEEKAWTLDKHIPIVVLVTIILQTVGGIWWFSGWSKGVEDTQAMHSRQIAGNKAQLANIQKIDDRVTRIEALLSDIRDSVHSMAQQNRGNR